MGQSMYIVGTTLSGSNNYATSLVDGELDLFTTLGSAHADIADEPMLKDWYVKEVKQADDGDWYDQWGINWSEVARDNSK